jgi:hypothetical protein
MLEHVELFTRIYCPKGPFSDGDLGEKMTGTPLGWAMELGYHARPSVLLHPLEIDFEGSPCG